MLKRKLFQLEDDKTAFTGEPLQHEKKQFENLETGKII